MFDKASFEGVKTRITIAEDERNCSPGGEASWVEPIGLAGQDV